MDHSTNADIILKEVSSLVKKYSEDTRFVNKDDLLDSEENVISLIAEHIGNKKSKVEILNICEKIFITDLSKLSKDKQRFFNYMRYDIPEILFKTLEKELNASDAENFTLTLDTINNIVKTDAVRYDPLADDHYAKPLIECLQRSKHLNNDVSQQLKNKLIDTLVITTSDSRRISFSDFIKGCLKSKNLHPQLLRFWKNSSGDIDYECVKGLREFMLIDNKNHLNLLHIISDLPVTRFSPDAAKMTYSVLAEILDKKPILKHKILDIVSRLYTIEYKYDNSAHIKANVLLYNIANKYPDTIDRIEQITHKKIDMLAPHLDVLPDLEYIFMGKEKPCSEKFKTISEGEYPSKFSGGLWASPQTANGYSEWCNYCMENAPYLLANTNSYHIVPKKNCRCLVAQSIDDLAPYFSREKNGCLKFDCKALCDNYDCLFVPKVEIFGNNKIYWGASSLVILKANKFDAYTEKEWIIRKQLSKKSKNYNER